LLRRPSIGPSCLVGRRIRVNLTAIVKRSLSFNRPRPVMRAHGA
jgi:hypothetical protein